MKWYFEKGHYLGFVDGDFLYRVAQDENGWYYEYVPSLDGMDQYSTAEEAKQAAERDYEAQEARWDAMIDSDEIDEILGDILYEERRDNPEVF